MSFLEAVKSCLSKFAVFSGRASRSEYWWFVLFVIVVGVVLSIVDGFILGSGPKSGTVTALFQLAMFLPLLAAAFRRLHDTGRPGWYALIPMFLGLFMSLIVFGGLVAVETGGEPSGVIALIGVTGLIVLYVVQIVLAILLIWWLTRPSEAGANEHGPEPS